MDQIILNRVSPFLLRSLTAKIRGNLLTVDQYFIMYKHFH